MVSAAPAGADVRSFGSGRIRPRRFSEMRAAWSRWRSSLRPRTMYAGTTAGGLYSQRRRRGALVACRGGPRGALRLGPGRRSGAAADGVRRDQRSRGLSQRRRRRVLDRVERRARQPVRRSARGRRRRRPGPLYAATDGGVFRSARRRKELEALSGRPDGSARDGPRPSLPAPASSSRARAAPGSSGATRSETKWTGGQSLGRAAVRGLAVAPGRAGGPSTPPRARGFSGARTPGRPGPPPTRA